MVREGDDEEKDDADEVVGYGGEFNEDMMQNRSGDYSEGNKAGDGFVIDEEGNRHLRTKTQKSLKPDEEKSLSNVKDESFQNMKKGGQDRAVTEQSDAVKNPWEQGEEGSDKKPSDKDDESAVDIQNKKATHTKTKSYEPDRIKDMEQEMLEQQQLENKAEEGNRSKTSKGLSNSDKIILRAEFQKTFEQVFEVMCFSMIKDATRGRIDLSDESLYNNKDSLKQSGNYTKGIEASVVSNNSERMHGAGVKKLHQIKNTSMNQSRVEKGLDGQGDSNNNNLQTMDFVNE